MVATPYSLANDSLYHIVSIRKISLKCANYFSIMLLTDKPNKGENLTCVPGRGNEIKQIKSILTVKFNLTMQQDLELETVLIIKIHFSWYFTASINFQMISLWCFSFFKTAYSGIHAIPGIGCQRQQGQHTSLQATGLDAWASRVKCPAWFVSHLHEICI